MELSKNTIRRQKKNRLITRATLDQLDPTTKLYDLPDSEFVCGGAVTTACRDAGYDESGRIVINNMDAWGLTVSQLAKTLAERGLEQ